MNDDIPINRVNELRQQKMMDNQIVQVLEQEGYMPTQIIEAINQANLQQSRPGKAVEGIVPETPMEQAQFQQEYVPEEKSMSYTMPNVGEFNMPPGTVELMQEIAEKIIEEKWHALYNEVMQIFNWKTKVESQISELSTKIEVLNQNITTLQEGILGKIKEYDNNIQEFGSEIRAMDKVFKNFVPDMKETITELKNVSKKFK